MKPYHVVAALYVAQTIPLLLVGIALPSILRSLGVSLAVIGALGLLLIPFALKFLWAPLVDRWGQRRTWILGAQSVTLLSLLVLSRTDPTDALAALFLPLFVLTLSSGVQDIATDGYAVEHAPPGTQARISAVQAIEGAGGVVLGGSLSLVIFDLAGWTAAILSAALLSGLATLPLLFVAEARGRREAVPQTRRPSVIGFLTRSGVLPVLALGLLFRIPDGLLSTLGRPFLLDAGLSLTTIASIYGILGAGLGIVGALLSVSLIRRYGLLRFLVALVVLRTLVLAAFGLMADDRCRPTARARWWPRSMRCRPISKRSVCTRSSCGPPRWRRRRPISAC